MAFLNSLRFTVCWLLSFISARTFSISLLYPRVAVCRPGRRSCRLQLCRPRNVAGYLYKRRGPVPSPSPGREPRVKDKNLAYLSSGPDMLGLNKQFGSLRPCWNNSRAVSSIDAEYCARRLFREAVTFWLVRYVSETKIARNSLRCRSRFFPSEKSSPFKIWSPKIYCKNIFHQKLSFMDCYVV